MHERKVKNTLFTFPVVASVCVKGVEQLVIVMGRNVHSSGMVLDYTNNLEQKKTIKRFVFVNDTFASSKTEKQRQMKYPTIILITKK